MAKKPSPKSVKTAPRPPKKVAESKPVIKPGKPAGKTAVGKTAGRAGLPAEPVKGREEGEHDSFNPDLIAGDNGQFGHLSEAQLKKVKTGLSRKDLDHYRTLLLEKRRELVGDVEGLQADAKNITGGGDLSNMPLHMADVGSDNYQQEFTLGLVESERKLLQEINQALLRINTGTYGVCMAKGVPIGKPRLDAKPWAKYCIEAARELEKQGIRQP